jgi:hypothetical protein
MNCIFVGIFDANNVHVFEYAMESDDDYFSVKYGRAYEYLRGQPQLGEVDAEAVGKERYMWLDKPSEDVYYFSDFGTTGITDLTYLREWMSLSIELVTRIVKNLSPIQQVGTVQFQMTPAKRRYTKAISWTEFERSIELYLFLAGIKSSWGAIAHNQHLKGLPNTLSSRSCTYRETCHDDEDEQPKWRRRIRKVEFDELVALVESETSDQ